ncbi:conserved hypothetical protein [Desulfamplus magnetovallimortis]|uniref:Caspase family p20 domain-containing protein n=1 Tax=Desulfamplus magnetovallimortis TaxID=1246637 RepID=A0A1W1H4X7_9BACT|nr:SUMF1/EgtB/PvdO family nonheme iron enzyme [Desulfamplus magnetovallimortis]SLM27492.1 conserved hypothetical protein [Desulfamplus magnetovallimortis]
MKYSEYFKKTLLIFLILILQGVFITRNHSFASSDEGNGRRASRVALVVGNGAYELAPLKNPVNDAVDMRNALEKSGFTVILKVNADKASMLFALDEFSSHLRHSEASLFYYAGHGMQINGNNYLIPLNAHITSETDVEFAAVNAGRVLGKMENAGNAVNIVILDACRANPFKRSFRVSERGLARMKAPVGSILAYATAPGSVAADGSGRNGLYTSKLIHYMMIQGLKIEEVLKKTRADVMLEARNLGTDQVPWESSSLTGDFYFIPPRSEGSSKHELPEPVNSSITDFNENASEITKREGESSLKAEFLFWQSIMNSHNRRLFEAYIKKYPEGDFVDIAKIKLEDYSTDEPEAEPEPDQQSQREKEQTSNKPNSAQPDNESQSIQLISSVQTGVISPMKTDDLQEAQSQQQPQSQPEIAVVSSSATKEIPNGTLHVDTIPEDSRIRIMNIKPKYYSGIELVPGKYHIEVSRAGYRTRYQWKNIEPGQELVVSLELEKLPSPTETSVEFEKLSSTPEAGDTWREPVTGMEFVWVPGGCYMMGSNSGDSDEQPVHEVCLDGFWIGKYEVTQGQWKKIMGNNPSSFRKGDDYPVEKVSWYDAQQFISKLNKAGGKAFSLPTEAQWEYAARSGGKNQEYSGSNSIDSVAWYGSNSGGSTHRVGTKAANGLGIYDMSGNVWEWCQDIYAKDAYSKHARNNPVYAGSGSGRVVRGGSWGNEPAYIRCAGRDWFAPGDTDRDLGFRLFRKN